MVSVSIEIPGGLIDKDETIEEAALRELGEETGQSGVIEVRVVNIKAELLYSLQVILSKTCPNCYNVLLFLL